MPIYVIHAPEVKRVKIGISGDPEARLKSLQGGSPTELILIETFQGDLDMEAALHHEFANYRQRGEWFDDEVLQLLDNVKVLADHRAKRNKLHRALSELEELEYEFEMRKSRADEIHEWIVLEKPRMDRNVQWFTEEWPEDREYYNRKLKELRERVSQLQRGEE